MYLRSIRFERTDDVPDRYPFSIPAIATLDEVELRTPVTFFAGENASGKSTLLEAIAAGVKAVPVRVNEVLTVESLAQAAELAEHLSFMWGARARNGFFLRAEDFFEYKKHLVESMRELGSMASDYGERFSGYGRYLARESALGQQRALAERYGEDPNAQSHGESFLQFFQARFTGPGLYLLDEPDTALSAQSALGLLLMLQDMTREGAQFLIATHSPILLAFPGATIISFDRVPIAELPYDEVEQVVLMRRFLQRPADFLHHFARD